MVHGRDIVVQRIVHLSVQFDRIAVHERSFTCPCQPTNLHSPSHRLKIQPPLSWLMPFLLDRLLEFGLPQAGQPVGQSFEMLTGNYVILTMSWQSTLKASFAPRFVYEVLLVRRLSESRTKFFATAQTAAHPIDCRNFIAACDVTQFGFAFSCVPRSSCAEFGSLVSATPA